MLSVVVLLVWVVPQFEQTFQQAGKALPLPTAVVVFVGGLLRNWWWAIAGGTALGGAVAAAPQPAARGAGALGRAGADGAALGDLVTKVEVARFARTLATLLGNGVTLLAGLGDRQGDDGQQSCSPARSTA